MCSLLHQEKKNTHSHNQSIAARKEEGTKHVGGFVCCWFRVPFSFSSISLEDPSCDSLYLHVRVLVSGSTLNVAYTRFGLEVIIREPYLYHNLEFIIRMTIKQLLVSTYYDETLTYNLDTDHMLLLIIINVNRLVMSFNILRITIFFLLRQIHVA